MPRPFISIIIPTRNRAERVTAAIDSVLNQTHQDFELIVVDDGSIDSTQEVLRAYGNRLTCLHIDHGGPSAARNHGIAAAKADLIAFLDSDDCWLPKKLERQLDHYASNNDVMVSQTREIWIRNGVRVNARAKHRVHSGWIYEQCLPLCIVSPSSVMIHRSVFEHVGLFDESMPACEDYDLWLRIAPHYPVHLIDEELIIKYGGHADQQSRCVPALDRLRIKAICKSLDSTDLTDSQRAAATRELQRKCRIYATGCRKRDKEIEARKYEALACSYAQIRRPDEEAADMRAECPKHMI
jgi:glycosyltransferase involved in cell wall biosynthesis